MTNTGWLCIQEQSQTLKQVKEWMVFKMNEIFIPTGNLKITWITGSFLYGLVLVHFWVVSDYCCNNCVSVKLLSGLIQMSNKDLQHCDNRRSCKLLNALLVVAVLVTGFGYFDFLDLIVSACPYCFFFNPLYPNWEYPLN